jgi:multicomponent Na+:H+ antiporter subunit D
MSAPPWLLSLPVVFPLMLGVYTLLIPAQTLRQAGRAGAVAAALSTLPCLHWVWHAGPLHQALGGWGAPLGIELYLDGLSALFLLFTALCGLGISFYAAAYFPASPPGQRSRSDLFWPLWFVTWGGIHSLFLTLDLFNIYVTLELVSVAGTGLILLAGTRGAIWAALQYQMQALIAGLMYLLGVGLIYSELGTLDLHQVAEQLHPGPMVSTGLVLMVAGLLVKAALFPMHFWLPPAHADAPAPVSAVLSGLVVTVAYVIVFRLWFAGLHRIAPDLLPRLMGALGAAGILWGGLLALRQQRLKRILAFSTVSQMGYLFLVFSLVLDRAEAAGLVWAGTVYMAIAHGLSKSAAFLAAGFLQKSEGGDSLERLRGAALRQPLAAITLALASINLIGLPPSTGFIGKWMLLKACFYSGQWIMAGVILLGGLLSAAYLFRVFEVLLDGGEESSEVSDLNPSHPSLRTPLSLLFPAFLLAVATLVPVLRITAPEALLGIGAPVEFSRFITPGAAP